MTRQESGLGQPDLPFDELVAHLRDILGVRLTGFIGGVMTASEVTNWTNGDSAPGEDEQLRLLQAYRAAALLRQRYDSTTVQSWFKGMNPALRDEAPAQHLREGEPTEAGREVIAAATTFAYIG